MQAPNQCVMLNSTSGVLGLCSTNRKNNTNKLIFGGDVHNHVLSNILKVLDNPSGDFAAILKKWRPEVLFYIYLGNGDGLHNKRYIKRKIILYPLQ